MIFASSTELNELLKMQITIEEDNKHEIIEFKNIIMCKSRGD